MDPLEKTSHACRAAALSLVPGLGHLYIGEKRGGPLLIVAGAGSGKTRVLTRRIAHLLATGDARPGEILAIVEAMKMMTEIKSDVSGTVKEVCVENEDLVECEQTLFLIEEA